MMLLIDDFTRYTWVFFLSKKSDAMKFFKEWQARAECQLERRVKVLRTDNGGEYLSKAFSDYLRAHGVIHQTSCAHSPQQNGVAERANRTICERSIAIMHSERIPLELWPHVVETVVYLKNRSPSRSVKATPYEMLLGRKPSLQDLRVFGCAAYVLIRKGARKAKLADRAVLCVFLGYSETQKAWRFWNPSTRKLIVSRDALFDEHTPVSQLGRPPVSLAELESSMLRTWPSEVMVPQHPPEHPAPRLSAPQVASTRSAAQTFMDAVGEEYEDSADDPRAVGDVPRHQTQLSSARNGSTPSVGDNTRSVGDTPARTTSPGPPASWNHHQSTESSGQLNSSDSTMGQPSTSVPSDSRTPPRPTHSVNLKPQRPRLSSSQLPSSSRIPVSQRYFWGDLPERTIEQPVDPSLPRTRSGRAVRPLPRALIAEPAPSYEAELDDYLGRPGEPEYHPAHPDLVDHLSGLSPSALATEVLSMDDPQSYSEAMDSADAEQWKAACEDELESLRKAGVYELVPRSEADGRVVTSKWVLKKKHHADGSLDRYKGRVVARGFTQVEGIDYSETFAPVAKFQSIRAILALAAAHNLELHQMDVKTAFLHGELDETVYMEPPQGANPPSGMVWKLKRSLYGLKQAPRAWNKKLHVTLLELDFRRTLSDHSIYVKDSPELGLIIVGVYVDDLTIAAEQLSTLTTFKKEMSARYEMKDLGELNYILGLQVTRDRAKRSLRLSQRHYVDTILNKLDMSDCKTARTPLPARTVLKVRADGEEPADRARYLTSLGQLMYLMLGTRPDIAFAVGLLSRFASDPSAAHWTCMVHVYRYLKGTRDLAIEYNCPNEGLLGYSDSDFASSDLSRRRCTSGFLFTLAGGSISWCSKRQPSVSIATGEAEYVAMSQAAREILWLRSLLLELGFAQEGSTILLGDNRAALVLAENPVAHTRSKQIDIRFHYLRELVERGVVKVQYTESAAQAADGLTKALTPTENARLLEVAGLTERAEICSPL